MKPVSYFLSGWRLACSIASILPGFLLAQESELTEFSTRQRHQIDSLCQHYVDAFHYPGLAVAIYFEDAGVWSGGYGYSHVDAKQAVDPDEDLFRIGSISKTITAMALARMVEEKKIDLDVPIARYLRGLSPDKSMLTLRQIGGHLSGIRHYRGEEFLSAIHYDNVIDPLEVFIHDSLEFPPGSKFGYSTYGWTLISAVMEKAAGIPFLDIIDQEVVHDLGVLDLKADETDSTGYPRVGFYDDRDSLFQLAAEVDISNKWAGGGLLCAADDLARIGHALVHPGYLHAESLRELTTSQKLDNGNETHYGIGISTQTDKNGRHWIGHSGGSVGGTSMMLIYPEENLVIITLVNRSSAKMNNLPWKIADLILNDTLDH